VSAACYHLPGMPITPLALITGASSGIGTAFAAQLARRRYDLLLVARRRDRLEQVAAELRLSQGVSVEILAADLTSDSDLARVEERIRSAGNLELLVNNAGFGTSGKFSHADLQGQDQMHRLHVLATLRLSHAALGGMVERDHGGIINVSSVAAFWQAPGNVSYCATKCWMNSFTEGLALELAATGSRVKMQALCPGYTLSEFHDTAGMDRAKIPQWLWMGADEVVASSLEGLERGATVVVPGWKYRLAVFFMKHASSGLLRRIAVRQQRRLGRD
jgi:short-subunit dehydrogenase